MTPKTPATATTQAFVDLRRKFKQGAQAVKNETTVGRKLAAGAIVGTALGAVAVGHVYEIAKSVQKQITPRR